MIRKLLNFIKTTPIFDTAMVSGSIFIASFLAYLLQFYLGRSLSVSDYGDFGALLSLSYLIGVPATVFGLSLTKQVSEVYATHKDLIPAYFTKIFILSVIPGVLLFILLSGLSSFFATYFNLNNYPVLIAFSISAGFSFFSLVAPSFLQGLQRFKSYSVFVIVYNIFRTVIPVVFVFLGYRLIGVFFGLALAAFFGFLYSYVHLKDIFFKKIQTSFEGNTILKKYIYNLFSFSVPVLLVNLSMMALNNIDVLMVKRYFSPEEAGHYVALVTVGKVLLFGAGTVATVMYPMLTAEFAKRTLTLSKFFLYFTLQVVVVVVSILIFSLFPNLIVGVMFGSKFLPIVSYLPLFSVFMGLYVLVNFMVLFFLSISRNKVFLIQIPFVLGQFYLLNSNISSITSYITINIAISFALLAVLLLYGYIQYSTWRSLKK